MTSTELIVFIAFTITALGALFEIVITRNGREGR